MTVYLLPGWQNLHEMAPLAAWYCWAFILKGSSCWMGSWGKQTRGRNQAAVFPPSEGTQLWPFWEQLLEFSVAVWRFLWQSGSGVKPSVSRIGWCVSAANIRWQTWNMKLRISAQGWKASNLLKDWVLIMCCWHTSSPQQLKPLRSLCYQIKLTQWGIRVLFHLILFLTWNWITHQRNSFIG